MSTVNIFKACHFSVNSMHNGKQDPTSSGQKIRGNCLKFDLNEKLLQKYTIFQNSQEILKWNPISNNTAPFGKQLY